MCRFGYTHRKQLTQRLLTLDCRRDAVLVRHMYSAHSLSTARLQTETAHRLTSKRRRCRAWLAACGCISTAPPSIDRVPASQVVRSLAMHSSDLFLLRAYMSYHLRPKSDRRQGQSNRRAIARGGRRASDDLNEFLHLEDDRDVAQWFSSAVVTLECRQCGSRTKATVDQLSSSAEVRCSGCGSKLRVNGEELSSALAQLAARIEDRRRKRSKAN